jgi:hypothetical protein
LRRKREKVYFFIINIAYIAGAVRFSVGALVVAEHHEIGINS